MRKLLDDLAKLLAKVHHKNLAKLLVTPMIKRKLQIILEKLQKLCRLLQQRQANKGITFGEWDVLQKRVICLSVLNIAYTVKLSNAKLCGWYNLEYAIAENTTLFDGNSAQNLIKLP